MKIAAIEGERRAAVSQVIGHEAAGEDGGPCRRHADVSVRKVVLHPWG